MLVCTPGRLLQHMDETPGFDCSQLQALILDEADRILDMVGEWSVPEGSSTFMNQAYLARSSQNVLSK